MNPQRLYLLLFIFLLSLFGAHSQTSTDKNTFQNWEVRLAKSGLDATTIGKIKNLIASRDQKLAQFQKEQAEQGLNNPIAFQDPEATIKHHNQLLIRALSKIIDLAQFKQLFLPQLEYRIERTTNDKLILLKDRYSLTADQEAKLKKLLYNTTTNEIVIKEYYNYDDSLSWNNYAEEKIKSTEKERQLLQSFGLLYSKNTKTDALIKKLKEAKVDTERINQILKGLQVMQEGIDRRNQTWLKNDASNIINFNDEGDSEYAIYLVFREELSRILNMDEFKAVFVSQMQNRILRDTQKEFDNLKKAHILTETQYNEIQKLVLEKNTEKIVTEEYYKYSWDLYQQKLRAVEYRHEKNIRETIQKMIDLNTVNKK